MRGTLRVHVLVRRCFLFQSFFFSFRLPCCFPFVCFMFVIVVIIFVSFLPPFFFFFLLLFFFFFFFLFPSVCWRFTQVYVGCSCPLLHCSSFLLFFFIFIITLCSHLPVKVAGERDCEQWMCARCGHRRSCCCFVLDLSLSFVLWLCSPVCSHQRPMT